jgi:putative ABC transport system permease protein
MYTFISILPGTDPRAIEAKLPEIVDKYNPALKERNQRDVLKLQPLHDIHLTSHLAEEPEPNGDERIATFLGIIGIFVLTIAWINYVNLSTAKAMERANEVGVRKVMGAYRGQLVWQFLSEAGLTNLASVILSVIIVALVLPSFNSLSGLNLDYAYLVTPWFLLTIAAVWLVGSLLAGFYPAFVISSFKPVSVLKGKMQGSRRGLFLRKSLVTVQFMSSVLLIAGTLIIYEQLNFMMSQDIGMDIEQVLVVERPGISPRDRQARTANIDAFRNELANIPAVQKVAVSVTIPGKQREYKAICKKYGASDDDLVTLRFNSMDYDFVDVFKMEMIAGRAFDAQHTQDGDTSVILSESATRLLGFEKPEDAVGQTIAIPGFQWNPIVVGVVNDYHQESLKRPLDPSIFYCTIYGGEFYSMRINTHDVAGVIPAVKTAWEKAFPGNPFDYFFLDDFFNRQYENEMKFGKLFLVFSAFAIFVGCLGLFGLSAFSAAQRTKEIGIRKALGSSVQSIFILLSKEYVKLVLVSIAIATPLIYFGAEYWIQTFPYHTEINLLVFIIAGLAVLMISLLTISYQTIKAARTNPVDSLRYE